jgi:hypothetical protein
MNDKKIAVLAGRRPDAPISAQARFPVNMATIVERRIRATLAAENIGVLVSSASAGADLLGIAAAYDLNIDTYVVLPADIERFRRTSVQDKGSVWLKQFDSCLENAKNAKSLVVVDTKTEGIELYRELNMTIIKKAKELAEIRGLGTPIAIIAWDAHRKPINDLSDHFRNLAEQSGFRLLEIATV